MNFHELKAMYLGFPVSSKMTSELRTFSEIIDQESVNQVIARINAILQELTAFTLVLAEKMDPVVLDPVSFTCNRCGRCCEQFTIGVAREDLTRMLDGKQYRMIPFLTLAESRPTFQFMNKKMFKANDLIYPPELIGWIKALNPSLDRIQPNDLSSCIFYDSMKNQCTVYDYRPAECRLYPVGNKLMGMTNLLCDVSCFEQGTPVDMDEFQAVYDENRPSDAAFATLYQLNPQGGWRLSAFKLALLFDRLAYVV